MAMTMKQVGKMEEAELKMIDGHLGLQERTR